MRPFYTRRGPFPAVLWGVLNSFSKMLLVSLTGVIGNLTGSFSFIVCSHKYRSPHTSSFSALPSAIVRAGSERNGTSANGSSGLYNTKSGRPCKANRLGFCLPARHLIFIWQDGSPFAAAAPMKARLRLGRLDRPALEFHSMNIWHGFP